MTKWWMLTGPYYDSFEGKFTAFLNKFDVHHWAYCIETGNTGYKHVHAKVECTENMPEAALRAYWLTMHIEPSNESFEYLRKEGGTFQAWDDTPEVREVRYGEPNEWQKALIQRCAKQSVREVTVLHDAEGGIGKSWLVAHLHEKNQAFFVPPLLKTPKDMIQYICSGLGTQQIIVIDIPRSWKWNRDLATTIEVIKDGLIFDARYSAKWKHIRGIKLIVFTNQEPPEKLLSKDRWDIVTPNILKAEKSGDS